VTPAGSPRSRALIRGALVLGLVVAIFFGVFPQLANLSDVWHHVDHMGAVQALVLGAVAIGSLLAYGLVLMSVMPGLTFAQATVVSQSSTAVANTMPAGGALALGVSYRFYGSWGYNRDVITRNVVVTGIWNVFAKLGMPVIALALIAITGEVDAALVAAAVVGVVVLVIAVGLGMLTLSSERGARRVGELATPAVAWVARRFRKPEPSDAAETVVRFRRDTIGLLHARGGRLTAAMVLSQLSVFLVLLGSLRAVGVSASEVGWVEMLAAYAVARLVSAIPITPGGVGLVELGLVGGLIAVGGPHAGVVAGVLVFRVLSFFLPLPFGLATYVVWRRERRWRRPAGAAPRLASAGGPAG
jgi:putative heme transporter